MTDAQRHDGPAQGLDADRLGALAVSEGPALYRMARSLVRDDDRAQDLVQQAFLRALERRGTFRGGDPAAWLRRIVWNLSIDQVRRGGRELPVDEIEERWASDDYTVDAERVVARAETRAELEDALIRLPYIYRSVLVLHDVEGWTVAHIADVLEIGLPAAKQRLRRGRMALVSALAHGEERREALDGVPLRCWDARRHVSEYMNGELTAAERAAIEAHLRTCPTCPPLYASLVGVRERLGDLRDPDSVVPPELGERIARALS
ncbi:MAG: sigma-70 family RNA polymerase sigma factor [Solirubrobacteraceae bacterium]|nr:sigma-70 family RNA polymerase sigma factor [Solirubrobacteraceae bacterium]